MPYAACKRVSDEKRGSHGRGAARGGGARECVPFPVRLCGECGKANESKNARMRIIKENK